MPLMASKKTIYLLTGDIGGTNSRMSLYDVNSDCNRDAPVLVKTYRNAEHIPEDSRREQPDCFPTNIVIPFLKYCFDECKDKLPTPLNGTVEILSTLAVAGVVDKNRVNLTNLGNLLIDGDVIADNTHDRYLKHVKICRIINDFVAVSSTSD
jgi:glucokinase